MTMEKRRIARVDLSGTIRGITEDGPNQQKLTGYFDFDLDSKRFLSNSNGLCDVAR